MKRYKLRFTLFALASIMAAGCAEMTPEISTDEILDSLQPMTFSASVLEEPGVKAEIDSLDIKWAVGDKIGIFDGTAFREFTLKSGAGTTSAVFEGEAASVKSYTAVYPYNENLSIDSEGKIHGLSVPKYQTAGACPVIMTAKCENGGNAFAFKSALAYVKVTPIFDCHKIVFETYGTDGTDIGYDLCGSVEIVSDSARVVGDSCSHVILSGEIISGNSYCIGVAPKRLDKGFKVIFDDAVNDGDVFDNGLQYAKKSNKTPDLLRGHVLNLGSFGKGSTDWTEGAVDLVSFETDGQDTEHFDDRAIYDWKDFNRIAACCEKTGISKTSRIYFLEDVDFGGRLLLLSVFNIPGADVRLYGLGHKIANYVQGAVTVDDNRGHAGLFMVHRLGSFCVEDLSLYPQKFDVVSNGPTIYAGAFLSSSYCSDSLRIRNCRVHGDIRVTCKGDNMSCAGGFAGIVESRGKVSITDDSYPEVYIENCLMEGSVTAYSEDDEADAGGFFGYMDGNNLDYICIFSRCRNKASILSEGDDDSSFLTIPGAVSAGGIVGCIRDNINDVVPRLISCVNEGSVTARAMDNDNAVAGGIVGFQDSDGANPVLPYLSNCLNRGNVTAISDDGIAGGLDGHCINDKTVFRNCVDDGELSGKKCAHISGSYGSYDSNEPCLWTKNDGCFGIYKKEEKDWYRVIIPLETLNSRGYDATWSMTDGHLDLDIVR